MRKTVVTLGIVLVGLGFSGVTSAQDLPAFCGPAGQLPAEFSGNVVADSRCFEIRMYTAEPAANGEGGIDNLHQRFREGEMALFEKHGAEIVAVWQRLDDPNTLVWMLAYRDRAHRDEIFTAFREDPDWTALLVLASLTVGDATLRRYGAVSYTKNGACDLRHVPVMA